MTFYHYYFILSVAIGVVVAFQPLQQRGLLISKPSLALTREPTSDDDTTNDDTNSRRQFLASSLLLPAVLVAPPANAVLNWEKDPVNKRSGVKVVDAERAGYTIAFVTYLTRFLLSFDPATQKYWFSKQGSSSLSSEELFAQLAASVEVGLQGYTDANGSKRLLQELSRRYGEYDESTATKRQKREAKEARRQLAILFALLEDRQPVQEISRLLASIDNGRITNVTLTDDSVTFGTAEPIYVVLPPPPAKGYSRARATPVLESTRRIYGFDIVDGGSGYTTPPTISINGAPLPVKVLLKDGAVTNVQWMDSSPANVTSRNFQLTIEPPPSGSTANVQAIPEQILRSIQVTNPGLGYLVEKPLRIYVTKDAAVQNATAEEIRLLYEKKQLRLVGLATPEVEMSSYTSFRKEEEGVVKGSNSGPDNGMPPLPFWTEKSSSSDLLRLLPAGIGLEYDRSSKRYGLAVDKNYQQAYPSAFRQEGRPLGPEFGPRGRAPIEKNIEYSTDVLLRFALSGAVCASGVHLALTPLDVVKTKVQTNPERYPNVPVSFGRVYNDEGPLTFFSGWLPTFLGNFISGGALYLLTEVIRKYLTEAAGPMATTYEVPIILAAAATASAFGAALICPFEAVRIRGVAKPDYAPNSVAVLQRMIREDGWFSLVNTIPVFLVKNVPYAMTKFTIFDLSTERLFEAIPAAQEELRLSLLISLIGGILGGTAAAVISNPADALISELKKNKTTDTSPVDVARDMWERGDNGPSLFLKGLGLRMVFYSLVASLQFCVYDFVRFSLGIGPDDLKLYLDVLGGALDGSGPP